MFSLFLSLITAASATTSTSTFQVTGIVPVIVKVSTVKTGNAVEVTEISNNPNGYVVYLSTDAKSVTYDGVKILNPTGTVILTQVTGQTKSVNVKKILLFYSLSDECTVTVETNL